MSESKIAGWSGIVFAILSLIVLPFALPPPPALGASGAEFAAWFGAHRSGFLLGNFLGIAAFFPGFVQLAILAAHIRKKEGEGGWLGALVLATGTFGYAVFACSLVVFQVLPFVSDPQLAGLVGTFASIWFALDGLAALPLVLAVGWAAVKTGILPRGIVGFGWVVAALALLMSLGALTATPAWLAGGGPATAIGFVAFFAWVIAVSVAFLRCE
jgi:hypothetical protein